MINLDASARPTFDSLLHNSRGTVFPECFYSFLHNYVSSINDLPPVQTVHPSVDGTPNPNAPPSSISSNTSFNRAGTTVDPPTANSSHAALPNDSDRRIERIWADYESIEPYIMVENVDETIMDVKVEYGSSAMPYKPFQVSMSSLRPCIVLNECRKYYLSNFVYPTTHQSCNRPRLPAVTLRQKVSSNRAIRLMFFLTLGCRRPCSDYSGYCHRPLPQLLSP